MVFGDIFEGWDLQQQSDSIISAMFCLLRNNVARRKCYRIRYAAKSIQEKYEGNSE